jgi:hypothetical protein
VTSSARRSLTNKVVLVISDGEDEGEVFESAVNEPRNAGVCPHRRWRAAPH